MLEDLVQENFTFITFHNSGDLHFGDLLYLSGAVAVEEGVKVNNELCPSSSITCTMLPEIEVPFKQGRRFVRSWDSFPEPEHGGIGLDNDGKGTLPGPLLINQNVSNDCQTKNTLGHIRL